eukprot:TRINITY_DN3705_c0_g1_i1.p1 TRINITY_DN3705_c0_g1~~TRINITY_DN3705_c0_g1_i1.p1  ORF type:complete len:217 (-),score=44.42 TRINITY_DN3705_c0_g1_i1:110-760(-)
MSDRCPVCGKRVYFAEKVTALNRDWHKWCFKCAGCAKMLTVGQQCAKNETPYCKPCYGKFFGTGGFGYGGVMSASTDSQNLPIAPEVPVYKEEAVQEKLVPATGGVVSYMRQNSRPISTPPPKTEATVTASRSGSRFGGAPKCPKCGKSVYHAEKVTALDKDWHKSCFKCQECGKALSPGQFCEGNSLPYCQTDYNKLFREAGFGYGGAASGPGQY